MTFTCLKERRKNYYLAPSKLIDRIQDKHTEVLLILSSRDLINVCRTMNISQQEMTK